MVYNRPSLVANPAPNLQATEADPAFMVQQPVPRENGQPMSVAVKYGFTLLLSDVARAVKSAIGLGDAGYISTTSDDIQALNGGKFQIDGTGNILLPTNPQDGASIEIIDPYRKLIHQQNRVIGGADETIGKGQVPSAKVGTSLLLQNDRGARRMQFIYSANEKNWSVMVDGVLSASQLLAGTATYLFTTVADLQSFHGAMIEVDKPGKVLLWQAKIGEYVTITDSRGLLAKQDNEAVALSGQVIGRGQLKSPKQALSLKNSNGAQWIRLTYAGDNNWLINVVTKNG